MRIYRIAKVIVDDPKLVAAANKVIDQNRYKKSQSKKFFIGDCVTGLNNDNFQRYVAQDATELAQLIENSNPISLSQFLDSCEIDEKFRNRIFKTKDIFSAGQFNDVIWLWDKDRDRHYFFM